MVWGAVPADVPGIHHVTAITADVQKNVDFYVTVLGLRFIKKTVNFDVPDTYHLYFGDYVGTPGTAMTFFGWPHLPWRPQGTGQVLNVAFAVPEPSLGYWWDRLRRMGIEARNESRFEAQAIVFPDADGIQLELVGQASDDRWQPWLDGPVPLDHAIRGFHSVGLAVAGEEASARFLEEIMGFQAAGMEDTRLRYKTGAGGPGSLLDLLVMPDAPEGEEAAGTVHHVAWRAFDDQHQLGWRDLLVEAGRDVTPVIDRKYFHSIYFREPAGVLFEIATEGPGFTVDESAESLGSALQLPPQYEGRRENLKLNLAPIAAPVVQRARA